MKRTLLSIALLICCAHAADDPFRALFNGRDLSGWKVPAGDNGHWRVIDGVIDYDARSEASGSKDLWTERSYRDFTLKLDWRIKETSGPFPVPVVLPDGTEQLDASGKPILAHEASTAPVLVGQ